MKSNNYVGGKNGRGWRIRNSGDAEFNTVTIRRQLEVASGNYNVGTVDVNQDNLGVFPSFVRIVYNTPIGFTEWQAPEKTYIASAGMSGTVTSDNAPNVYWGWTVDVLPLTRWEGNQSLRLRLCFWGQNVKRLQNCTVHWKIYEVS